MNILAKIVSSRVRSEIFRILFGTKSVDLHIRGIARCSGLTESNVRKELRNLDSLGLVYSRRDSNRVYYRANENHPLYQEIHNLVLKTSGIVEPFREALDDKRIGIAFIFGSIAEGNEKAGSDVDLIVIGEIGLRELSGLLSGLAEKIGREINPHVFSGDEFSQRLDRDDPFLSRVIPSSKLFIKGSEDDLRAMGE